MEGGGGARALAMSFPLVASRPSLRPSVRLSLRECFPLSAFTSPANGGIVRNWPNCGGGQRQGGIELT